MKISEIELRKIEIPFKVGFKHSSAERNQTYSVAVEVTSDCGFKGYGEGCPREYVTGESLSSVEIFFGKYNLMIINEIDSIVTLKEWIRENIDIIDQNPSAWCAIEMALIDLIAKSECQTVESILGLPELNGKFKYTAVLGDSSIEIFESQLKYYISMEFSDFKVKISGDILKDTQKFRIFENTADKKLRIRIDANNLWENTGDVIQYIDQIDIDLFGIEEPVGKNRYDKLNEIAKFSNTKVILDESFLNIADFEKIKNRPNDYIINIRVSKMGGIVRSLKIAEKAKELNIGIIIGAQVGETSLLTRGALTVANAYKENLAGQEGAFGTYLLERDLANPELQFGKGGLIEPANLLPSELNGFQMEFSYKDCNSF